MRLCIADWYLEIDCSKTDFDRLPNYKSFIVPDHEDLSDPALCRIETNVRLSEERMGPMLTKELERRNLSLWLSPDYCSISLTFTETMYVCRLRADRSWKKIQTDWVPGDDDSYIALNDIVMLAFTYSAAFNKTILLHASCIVSPYGGCAFIGPSGIGKSTHSRLWLTYIPGTRLLNDDQPVIRQLSDGHIYIYGSPWSGKTPCYYNDKVILKAMFFMKQCCQNRLVRTDGVHTFQKLVEAASVIGSDINTFSVISETLAIIAGQVPAYILENCADKESVMLSSRAVASL